MNTLDERLAADLAIEFTLPSSPAEELERMADLHRRGMTGYIKRSADARKACRAAVAELEDERRRLKQVHSEDMQRLDAEVAAIKASTAEEIAMADKLAAVSRAALEALQS
ncbi:hypothetical protein ASD44_09800 [Mesorhizobium sp. Root554]|uniref:hypothetical protein n=1 Tax=unclassified Mesorhizobium TaxID=325217 RepID=UPI0006FCF44D|nr:MULTISPECIES: hypothetical protein [unclassified Mesorhizobium]KQZ14332.1 hypothetical protein ASD27_09810 [Mesorhizobium sp. Root1471]KQZ36843.1 hypothetical protein ASD44_09800 [Mesorhizobium sp. Root554]